MKALITRCGAVWIVWIGRIARGLIVVFFCFSIVAFQCSRAVLAKLDVMSCWRVQGLQG